MTHNEWPKCGMIFEFSTMEHAQNFAKVIRQEFGLACRVFDDAEAAARSHVFPWEQKAPVVHVDRPDPERCPARAIERTIDAIAERCGGEFIGT